jgi:hypothetical protein
VRTPGPAADDLLVLLGARPYGRHAHVIVDAPDLDAARKQVERAAREAREDWTALISVDAAI